MTHLDGKQPSNKADLHQQTPTTSPRKSVLRGFIHADRRTREAKRYVALVEALTEASPLDDGPGKSALVSQAASLTLAYEKLTADLIAGKQRADALVRVSNSLNRILSALGIVSWLDGAEFDPKKPTLTQLRDPKTWRKD